MDVISREQLESKALDIGAETRELLDLLLNCDDYHAATFYVRAAHPDALRATVGQLVSIPEPGNLIDTILKDPAKGAKLRAIITFALTLIVCRAAGAAAMSGGHPRAVEDVVLDR
jgi:hypothetical protein